MSLTTIRWLLFIALLLVLPLPFHLSQWVIVPFAYLFGALFGWPEVSAINLPAMSLLLLVQLLLSAVLLWGLAFAYTFWSIKLPVKIRGPIMGLLVLSSLILFSSFPVYDVAQLAADNSQLTFLQIYQ
jgi:hypothetical protein